MTNPTQIALDPTALATFAASLGTLPSDEIRKVKSLYIRNAIADYRMVIKSTKSFLIVMGIMSLFPLFLIVFLPAYYGYKAAKENGKQKIKNALEVWKEDLGADYIELTRDLERS